MKETMHHHKADEASHVCADRYFTNLGRFLNEKSQRLPMKLKQGVLLVFPHRRHGVGFQL